MNPSYLNPSPSSFPFIDLNEDQHLEHLISSPHHATPISSPIYFNLSQEYQTGGRSRESLQNEKKVEKIVLSGGSTDRRAIASSSSSSSSVLEPTAGDMVCKREDHEDEGKSTTGDDGSMKWMSPKMRVMRKMINSNSDKPASRVVHKFNDDQINSTNYNSNDFVRVCSDCYTTKTPLWRGGPQGPKSLCNACGIRQRKARRAMALAAAAANGTELNTETSTSTKIQNKEKKSRTSYIPKNKKHFKFIGSNSAHTCEKKLSFEDFALSLINKKNLTFRDEEEAAILLMALSCGLIHN